MARIRSFTLGLALLCTTPASLAWESADGQWASSASVSLSTDYIWRGASQTDNEPAVSGSIDLGHDSGLYMGIWGSNVDFAKDVHVELNGYFGYAGELADSGIAYDVQWMHFRFPGTSKYKGNEATLALSYHYFSLSATHTDSNYSTTYYQFDFDYDLPFGVALNLQYAIEDVENRVEGDDDLQADADELNLKLDDTIENYSLGLSKSWVGFDFELRYHGVLDDLRDFAKADGYSNNVDNRFLFTISKSL